MGRRTHTNTWIGRAGTLWFVLALLLALALRLYGIETQSLWADEGTSVALATRSFARIAQDAAHDIHPPLYYWTLHLWAQLAGLTVPAVRGLSALYGVLLVALTYILGRRWFGAPAAAVAAFAAALSPFAIHYSQETRMYILVTLFGALSWLAFGAWLACPRWQRLALYWLAALAALYTHYFAVALVAAHNLVWLIAILRGIARRPAPQPPAATTWRMAAGWLAAQAGLVAAYAPLVWYSRETLLNWTTTKEPIEPLFILGETARIFSLGPSVPPGWSAWTVGFLLLLGVGLWARPRPGSDGRLLAAAWLFVPLALIVLLSLNRPFYKPRFLLLALPGMHLLIGHAAAALAARLRAPRVVLPAAVVFLTLAARQPLVNEWFNPAFWRDDYRGIARDIAATAGPDDAILLQGPGQIEILDYYYHGPLPRYPLPRYRPLDPAATTHELEAIARRHRRLYAVLWVPYESDPGGLIEGWLETHAFRATNRWYGGVQLVMYEFGDLGDALRPVDARFGPHVRLARAAIAPLKARGGDVVRVATEWQTDAPLDRPLNMFAHLLDSAGRIVGEHDAPPTPRPVTGWPVGTPQEGRLGIYIPLDTPPGRYRLIAGVYDPQTSARLRLPGGADVFPLAEIDVERAP